MVWQYQWYIHVYSTMDNSESRGLRAAVCQKQLASFSVPWRRQMAASPPGLTPPVLRCQWLYRNVGGDCEPCDLHRDISIVRGHETALKVLSTVTANVQETTVFRSSNRSNGRGNSSKLCCALAKRGKPSAAFAPTDGHGSGGSAPADYGSGLGGGFGSSTARRIMARQS